MIKRRLRHVIVADPLVALEGVWGSVLLVVDDGPSALPEVVADLVVA